MEKENQRQKKIYKQINKYTLIYNNFEDLAGEHE